MQINNNNKQIQIHTNNSINTTKQIHIFITQPINAYTRCSVVCADEFIVDMYSKIWCVVLYTYAISVDIPILNMLLVCNICIVVFVVVVYL